MKKFLAFFLVIALMLTSCLALVSCNKDNGDENSNTAPDFSSMEPDEMFKESISYAITEGTDMAFSVYEKLLSTLENTASANATGTAASGVINAEVSPLFLGSILPGLSVSNIAAEYDVNIVSDKGASIDLTLSGGNVELGKAEVYFEKETSALYVSLPGLAESTLKIDDFSSVPIETVSSLKLLKYLSTIENYIPKALKIALDKITDVEKSEVSITANGVTAESVMLTTKLTATVARDMLIAVIDDLTTSEDIKELIVGFYNDNAATLGFDYYESADALYTELMAMLEEEKALIAEDLTDNGEEILVNLYFDSKCTHLTGIEIELSDGTFTYSVLGAENGNEIGQEAKITFDGTELATALLKGTKVDGVLNGSMTVNSNGDELLTVEFENVNYEEIKDGKFGGKYTIIPGEVLSDSIDSLIDPSSMKLVIDIKEISTDKTDFSLALLMAGFDINSDTTLIKLSVTNEKTDSKPITFPTETVSDAEAWAASINTDELMSRLVKLGISEDILSGIIY